MTISLIAKGAEACLYLEKWYEFTVVRKHRIPKKYRLASLDQPLRRERTIREARMLNAARRAGVRTPIVFSVVPEEATIIMEYIQGDRLKESLPTFTTARRSRLFQKIGSAIARLHQHNLSHGDLTTSNMLLHPNYQVYFIDFGLAETTQDIEDFGTDLHLLRRALLSTHYQYWQPCFTAFKKGYRETYGSKATSIFQKIEAIESRGRYVKERIR